MEVKDKLKSIVDSLLNENLSGVEFFDKLDDLIKDEKEMILSLVKMVPENYGITISGGFGNKLKQIIDSGEISIPYILYKGGIRSGSKPEIIKNNLENCNKTIFLDDTIYGGKTYFDIKEHVKKIGVDIESVFVIYDGSPVKRDFIKSFYRYYDHYKSKSNFNF